MGCASSKPSGAGSSNTVAPEPVTSQYSPMDKARVPGIKGQKKKGIAFEIPLDEEFKTPAVEASPVSSPKPLARGHLPALSVSKEEIARKIKEAERRMEESESSSGGKSTSKPARPPTSKRRPAPFQGLDLEDGEAQKQSPEEIARRLKEREDQAERRRKEREEEQQRKLEDKARRAQKVQERKKRLAAQAATDVAGAPSDLTISRSSDSADNITGEAADDDEVETYAATQKTRSSKSTAGTKKSAAASKRGSKLQRGDSASSSSTASTMSAEEEIQIGGKQARYSEPRQTAAVPKTRAR